MSTLGVVGHPIGVLGLMGLPTWWLKIQSHVEKYAQVKLNHFLREVEGKQNNH